MVWLTMEEMLLGMQGKSAQRATSTGRFIRHYKSIAVQYATPLDEPPSGCLAVMAPIVSEHDGQAEDEGADDDEESDDEDDDKSDDEDDDKSDEESNEESNEGGAGAEDEEGDSVNEDERDVSGHTKKEYITYDDD